MSMVQNHYVINITLDRKHLFATEETSCVTEHDLKRLLPVLVKKFPESEGYGVSVSKICCHGEALTEAELIELGIEATGDFHNLRPAAWARLNVQEKQASPVGKRLCVACLTQHGISWASGRQLRRSSLCSECDADCTTKVFML